MLTKTKDVDSTDSINRNVQIQTAGRNINTHTLLAWVIQLRKTHWSACSDCEKKCIENDNNCYQEQLVSEVNWARLGFNEFCVHM